MIVPGPYDRPSTHTYTVWSTRAWETGAHWPPPPEKRPRKKCWIINYSAVHCPNMLKFSMLLHYSSTTGHLDQNGKR